MITTTSAAPGSKGQKSLEQGKFLIWYLPKYSEHLPQMMGALEKAERAYVKAGYALPSKIPVLMAARMGGSASSMYTKGFIQIVPFAFTNQVHFSTLVHEIAHYIHAHQIPGGFSNRIIQDQYADLRKGPVENTGGNALDRAEASLGEITKRINQTVKKIRPGVELSLLLPTGWNQPEVPRRVRVVKQTGNKTVVEFLEPTADELATGVKGTTLSGVALLQKMSDPEIVALMQQREQLLRARSVADEGYRDKERYTDHRSKWFPTEYSKTNSAEWFAELVAARVLAPESMAPDVKTWVDSMVKRGTVKVGRNQKVIEIPNTFHEVEVGPAASDRFAGYISFQGLEIDVENLKGSTRKGKGPEGEWSVYMFSHYGEIRDTEGVDGDNLDVYVGDNHDSSLVVVVHQHKPWDGSYDEDKVMLGFDSIEEAVGAYKKQYNQPGFYKEHTAMPIGAFWRWVHDEKKRGLRVKVASIDVDAVTRALKNMKTSKGFFKSVHVKGGMWYADPTYRVEADDVYQDDEGGWGAPGSNWQNDYADRLRSEVQKNLNAGFGRVFKVDVDDKGLVIVSPLRGRVASEPPIQRWAQDIAKAVAPGVAAIIADVAEKKEIGRHPLSYATTGANLIQDEIVKKLPALIKEALEDRLFVDDYEGDFMREVLRPAMATVFKSTPRFKGFSELSVIPLFKKMDPLPGQKVLRQVQDEIDSYRRMDKKAAGTTWFREMLTMRLGSLEGSRPMFAMLRALHWTHLAAHWQAQGMNSYSDHLLFQRLYENVEDEIDKTAEKLIGLYGNRAGDPVDLVQQMAGWVAKWSRIEDPVRRALQAEADFQTQLEVLRGQLERTGGLTLGLDDLLQSLANAHEEHRYLLKQRAA